MSNDRKLAAALGALELEHAAIQRLEAQIKRVRKLHYKTLDDPRCQVCWSETYPCPTIKALDGELDD